MADYTEQLDVLFRKGDFPTRTPHGLLHENIYLAAELAGVGEAQLMSVS